MTRRRPASQIRNPQSPIRNAFTLIELLVSIAILALLTGLTLKGVSKFRQAGWSTDTTNQIMTIGNAIQAYHSTFNANPGPIPNRTVGATVPNASYGITFPGVENNVSPTQFDPGGAADIRGLTGSENLVLGLFGGLKFDPTVPGIIYDPGLVGQGPSSLNPLSPKKSGAFLDAQNQLSWRSVNNRKTGKYQDDAAQATDTVIPELVDRFPQGMPILYLRADRGAAWNASLVANPSAQINNVITDDSNANPAQNVAQYHRNHIKGYVDSNIGESKKAIAGNSTHGLRTVTVVDAPLDGPGPYANAYQYFVNHDVSTQGQAGVIGSGHVARKKDDYILISPGVDRIYGTKDDITNFGSVIGN
jgi:prepilin-type N-terminal cleavage/methylation domain-containing protein